MSYFTAIKPNICSKCSGFITLHLDGWQCINCGSIYYRGIEPSKVIGRNITPELDRPFKVGRHAGEPIL